MPRREMSILLGGQFLKLVLKTTRGKERKIFPRTKNELQKRHEEETISELLLLPIALI